MTEYGYPPQQGYGAPQVNDYNQGYAAPPAQAQGYAAPPAQSYQQQAPSSYQSAPPPASKPSFDELGDRDRGFVFTLSSLFR